MVAVKAGGKYVKCLLKPTYTLYIVTYEVGSRMHFLIETSAAFNCEFSAHVASTNDAVNLKPKS